MICPDCGKEMFGSFVCGNCGEARKELAIPEPMSEDDCPADYFARSTSPVKCGTEQRAINYIRQEGEPLFKPINVQIEDAELPGDTIADNEKSEALAKLDKMGDSWWAGRGKPNP